MVAFLFIMSVVLSGAIGYFVAYVQNEKAERLKKMEESKKKHNPWAWHQPYSM